MRQVGCSGIDKFSCVLRCT